MRLWSIHPKYLDAKGLVALWREGLLAQHVLCGKTQGYKNHPQLNRFKAMSNPQGAIASYLRCVADEADRRGYQFDRGKIIKKFIRSKIKVSKGQVDYEFSHLLNKLKGRDLCLFKKNKKITQIKLHPVFVQVHGSIAEWEIL